MMNKKVLFFGCGNMGTAILTSLISNFANLDFFVIDNNFNNTSTNVTKISNALELKFKPDIIFLAVKPQTLPEIKDDLKHITTNDNIIISILAGTSTDSIAQITGAKSKIVRLMPNIAAIKSNSTSSCFFNKNLNPVEKDFILELFKSFGICETLSDESDMHISTIINGGAIAYLALIVKYIKQSALKHSTSLTEQQIHNLLYNTYQNLIDLDKDEDELISLICSKKGTTEAVIDSLKNQKIEQIIAKAIEDGVLRSIELGKKN